MKLLVAVALVATSFPVVTTAAAASDNSAPSARRVCSQPTQARAGSRMGPRRICRSETQWRQALGPDWRRLLTGRTLEDDQDMLEQRTAGNNDHNRIEGVPVGHPSRQLGPN